MKASTLILLFPLFSWAQAVGFSLGNTLKATPVSGQVTVFCTRPGAAPAQAIYQCRDIILEPSAYDFFRGPKGLNAETVTLTALREDGSSRAKSQPYDSHSSRSKNSFNLWISTLFQRPLLKEGRNEISYTLVQNKATVGQGQFEVLVQRGQSRQCPTSQYTSNDSADCESQFTVCQRYFYQYNNCVAE